VKLNTTEMWVLQNGGGGWFHPVHIHRNKFRIVGSERPGAGAARTVTNLEHEDMRMMTRWRESVVQNDMMPLPMVTPNLVRV
jgi:FtsP/CotA-like multicopper oxidase with cupredoxin domain